MRIEVLDHGYVELIEYWGSDERIIEAARMSTGKGFIQWTHYRQCRVCNAVWDAQYVSFAGQCIGDKEHDWRDVPKGDAGLLRYLWTNKHATPFEMAGLTVEVQAPIFVFREWHRHRTQSYNEKSARYAPLPDVNYVPTEERLLLGGGHLTKQAASAGGQELDTHGARWFIARLAEEYARQEHLYQEALERGVPKELARCVMPVGRYSAMRAQANLRNWLAFLTLRMAPNAQWELRQYANAVGEMVQAKFPRTWELFAEGLGKG